MHTKCLFIFILFLLCPMVAHACNSCYVPHKGVTSIEGESSISSGPMITVPTASIIGKNHVSGGFTFNYARFNSIPAENVHSLHHTGGHDIHGKRHEEIYDSYVGYGATDDLDLLLSFPFNSKTVSEVHSHKYLGRDMTSSGFGDMRLITKYRFWKKLFEAALIGGIKFPTGVTSEETQFGEEFEAEQQPGSGSWDGEFGLALSRSFKKRFSVATAFQYAMRTKGAQDYELGDLFVYSFGTSAALKELGKYPNLSFALELINKWSQRDIERDGMQIFDSGGTTMLLSPGIVSDVTKNFSLFCSMPIPIYQNLGGEHEELAFEVLSGVNFRY